MAHEDDNLVGLAPVPDAMKDFLMRIGGRNPYGKNVYRLVVAENRRMKEAGEMTEWRPGATVAERGGTVTEVINGRSVRRQSTERPLGVTVGIRLVRKYPGVEGWLLERWYPAILYGSRYEWDKEKTANGIPLLGPYPEEGDFEMVAGPCGEMPNTDELRQVIEYIEAAIHNRRESVKERTRRRLEKAQRDEEQRADRSRKETFERLHDEFWWMRSSSLEAGRIREEHARAIRARGGQIGHVGN